MTVLDVLKQLRDRTGASYADCRLALDGAGGDVDRAERVIHDLAVSRLQDILKVDAWRAAELVSRYGWDFEQARRHSVDWKAAAAERRARSEREATRPPVDRARDALQEVGSYYDLLDRGVLLEVGQAADGSWPDLRGIGEPESRFRPWPEATLAEGQETLQWLGLAYLLIFTDHAAWFWDSPDFGAHQRALAALDGAGWADVAGHIRTALDSTPNSIDQESEFSRLVRNVEEGEIFTRLKSWILAHANELPCFTGRPDTT